MPDIPTAAELRARVPARMHELRAEVARLARERDRLRAERDRLFEWAWDVTLTIDAERDDGRMEPPVMIRLALATMTGGPPPCAEAAAALAAHDAEVNRADA